MITYDYQALEQLVDEMESIASEINTRVEEQRQQVKQIMNDWHGSTADNYNSLCNELEAQMAESLTTLRQFKVTVATSAQNMQDADNKGGAMVGH